MSMTIIPEELQGQDEKRCVAPGRENPKLKEKAAVPQRAAGAPQRVSTRRGCSGCGGARYSAEEYNRPGGSDALIQELG